MKKGFVALVGMMLLSAGMLSGDTIKLRNGQEYEGKVVVRGDVYTVIQGDAVFQFQKKEVAEMNGEKLVREENPVIRIATSKATCWWNCEDRRRHGGQHHHPAESGFTRAWPFRIINGFMAQGGCGLSAAYWSARDRRRDTALRMSLRQI